MFKPFFCKKLAIVLCLSLLLSSCGTFIRKERRFHERSSKIDYYILALDSIGLAFLIIPGVVALYVDYSNGTLFLSKQEAYEQSQVMTQQSVTDLVVDP